MENKYVSKKETVYSFSRIGAFDSCPLAYKMRYIDGKTEEKNAFAVYGSFVHFILEKYFRGELEIFELEDYYVDNYQKEVNLEFPPNEYVNLSEKYYSDGLRYFEDFDDFNEYKVLGVEQEFTIDILGGKKLRGFIDLLLEDKDGNIIIVDHKSKIFRAKKEINHYARQLFLYSLYVNEKYKKDPIKVVFNTFRDKKKVEIKYDRAKVDEALQWADETIKRIESCEKWEGNYDAFFCNNICGFSKDCLKKLEVEMFG